MALRSPVQRKLLFAFIGSIVSCGLLGIYCLLVGRLGPVEEKILGTTAAVGACSILALAAAVPWERRRWHPIGPIAMGFIVLSLALSIFEIWFDSYPHLWEIRWERIMAASWVCAVGMAHIGLLSLARLRSQWQFILALTVSVIGILISMILYSILNDFSSDPWMRGMGVFGILSACGTITVPILHRISAIRTREAVRTTVLSISITCPRCTTTQVVEAGRSSCKTCHMRFNIEIEENNCLKCGYPLYQLQSSVCPECGTPIAAEGGSGAGG